MKVIAAYRIKLKVIAAHRITLKILGAHLSTFVCLAYAKHAQNRAAMPCYAHDKLQ